MTLCRKALATSTRTLATGSEERLNRLGKRCWLNWSMGMQSSSTMAYRKEKQKNMNTKQVEAQRQQESCEQV